MKLYYEIPMICVTPIAAEDIVTLSVSDSPAAIGEDNMRIDFSRL